MRDSPKVVAFEIENSIYDSDFSVMLSQVLPASSTKPPTTFFPLSIEERNTV